jgi:hypothetical protein
MTDSILDEKVHQLDNTSDRRPETQDVCEFSVPSIDGYYLRICTKILLVPCRLYGVGRYPAADGVGGSFRGMVDRGMMPIWREFAW